MTGKKTITVTVAKTLQTASYEPVTVTITETIEFDSKTDSQEAHMKVYRGVTKSVKTFIDNELAKYATAAKRDQKRNKD